MKVMRIISFLLLFILTPNAFSTERPEWTLKAPPEDATFKYYLGRTSDSPNEQSACASAFRDAFEGAIRSNFGFRARVQTESYTTEKTSSGTTRYDEVTQEVRLQGFEKVDEYIESGESGRKSCFGLYRYPKSEAEKERIRLQSLGASQKDAEFSVQGIQADAFKGVLEVTTKPSGAVVYIDGERFGKTPLRLIGQLEAGQHQLRIDHVEYEAVDERITAFPNVTTNVHKTLVKASGKVNIITEPYGASLIIDGRPAGLTPLPGWIVEAGVKHRLEVSHPEAEKYVREFEVERGGTANLQITLPLKPAALTVFTTPADALIQIDSEEFKAPLTSKRLEAGSYRIRVTKEGYVSYEDTVVLRGGEKRALPTVKLVSISEEEKQRQGMEYIRAKYLAQDSWVLSFGVGYSGSSIQDVDAYLLSIHASVEKRIVGWFGIKVLYAGHGYSKPEDTEKKSGTPNTSESIVKEISASELSLSVPFYFYENFYFAPEAGLLNGKIKNVTRSYSSIGIPSDGAPTEKSFHQNFWSVSLGHSGFRNDTSQWGWFGEMGYRHYGDADSVKGSSGLLGRIGISYRF